MSLLKRWVEPTVPSKIRDPYVGGGAQVAQRRRSLRAALLQKLWMVVTHFGERHDHIASWVQELVSQSSARKHKWQEIAHTSRRISTPKASLSEFIQN